MASREDFTQLDAWLDKLLDAPPAERTQILSACTNYVARRLCALLAANQSPSMKRRRRGTHYRRGAHARRSATRRRCGATASAPEAEAAHVSWHARDGAIRTGGEILKAGDAEQRARFVPNSRFSATLRESRAFDVK